MLTCPPSRINLTAADLSDFERRWATRRPARPLRPPPANARLFTGAAQLTKLGYVPASANSGRKRAQSCSSQATICTVADDEAVHSGDDDAPLSGPSGSTREPFLGRSIPPVERAVERDTNSIADSIESSSPRRRSPQKLPAHFTIHEESTLDKAETEARELRKPQIFSRAVVGNVVQQLTTAAPDLVRPSDEAHGDADEPPDDSSLNPSLDAEAPVFITRTRFGTVANHSANNSHGGVRLDSKSADSIRAQPAHLQVQSSFERNTQRSSHDSQRENASSSRLDTIPPVRVLQTPRRSRTQDQNAAMPRMVPDLDRYPAMPTLPPIVGMSGRRSSAGHRRVMLPRRRSSRAHLVEFERARMAQMATYSAPPSQRADMSAPHQGMLRPASPAPSSSSRSTPNLLVQGLSAPVIHPRRSSWSWNRSAIPEETQPLNMFARGSNSALSSRAFEDHILNRDSPLEEVAKQGSRLAARLSQRSVGRSHERTPGSSRPSLLDGDPFALDPSERSVNRPPVVRSPPHQATAPYHEHSARRDSVHEAIEKFTRAHEALERQSVSPKQTPAVSAASTIHRSQTQTSLSSAFEDPVAFALALPPETVPLSPASTPLPSSPGSPSSAYVPSTPPVYSPSASPRHSSARRSSIARSSINRIPQSLDAAVTPKVTIYNDDKSPTTQPQTPADVTRSGRRFRPLSDMGSMHHHSTLTTLAETPSHAAMERNPHRNTYPTATPPNRDVGQYDDSGLTPARQQLPAFAQRVARAEQRRRDLSENEAEAHLANVQGMEQDRRTWIARQEDGTLNVTPPREGRWERYLS